MIMKLSNNFKRQIIRQQYTYLKNMLLSHNLCFKIVILYFVQYKTRSIILKDNKQSEHSRILLSNFFSF